jgi:hypothetical protein
MRFRVFIHLTVAILVSSCGGGESVTEQTANETSTSTTGGSSGARTEAAPPAHSTCRVVVEEAGGQGRTSEYSFEHGVLTRVVVTDAVSGRSFTTRYTWDEDRSAVRVEKLAEGQEPRPPFVMRYRGARGDGEIVGEHEQDGSLLERVTWYYDDEERPVRCDHEWLPSPEERSAGMEARAESDACSYDGEGRPATYELSLEGEPVLLIFFRYAGDSDIPSGIVEKHIVGPEVPPRDNSIAEVEPTGGAGGRERSDAFVPVRVTWPGEGADRATRYAGDCRAVFFPAVCSSGAAP